MRYCVYAFGLLMLIMPAEAQKKKNWYLLPQVGLQNGVGVVSSQVMLSGGIVRNGWDIGLGAGIDYYGIRTVPLVVDIRKSIGNLPVFVYADIGYNFAAPLKNQYMYPEDFWIYSKSSFSDGWYGESGVGYDVSPKRNQRFVFSIGYSIKTAWEKYTEKIPRDFPPYYGERNEHAFNYQFNRVVLKLGFRL